MKYPRQPNGEGGWTIKAEFLSSLVETIERQVDFHEEPPSMEQIEMVLIALETIFANDRPELVECPYCSPDGTEGFPDGRICWHCGGKHDITTEEYNRIMGIDST